MIKFFMSAWSVLGFLWKYIKPIYGDLMEIIAQVKASGLVDDVARKKVTQLITDKIQLKGLDKVPDSVLNCTIELCYQIYVWKATKK